MTKPRNSWIPDKFQHKYKFQDIFWDFQDIQDEWLPSLCTTTSGYCLSSSLCHHVFPKNNILGTTNVKWRKKWIKTGQEFDERWNLERWSYGWETHFSKKPNKHKFILL